MRKLIAGMKVSIDGKVEGPDGTANWVKAWSEDYGLMPQIDACVLGAGMYPGYEWYWTSVRNEPDKSIWITGNPPTPAEREWACFAAQTPHYVLSSTLTSTQWPNTTFVRTYEEIAALKQQSGKDIYLVGGARTAAGFIDAGWVDELRLIVYPLIVGEGKSLFEASERLRDLELQNVEELPDGCVSLTYRVG
jgi:dihydrofolate reductase